MKPRAWHRPFLRFGHVSAGVALVVSADATRHAQGAPLPVHAAIVFACALILRAFLFYFQLQRELTKTHYAIFLALSASATFATSAMHVVATRVDAPSMLPLVASTALDISALWMRMAATVKSPSRSAYPLLFGVIYALSDAVLAAVIAAFTPLASLIIPALVCRALLNACRLAAASRTILLLDARRK